MSTERLEAIQSELTGILEERLEQLRQSISETEELTQKIVTAELEIARSRQQREGLDDELARIEDDKAALRARADEVRARYDGRINERDELRDELRMVEEENEKAQTDLDLLRKDLRDGEGVHERLQSEHKQLQDQYTALQQETERMRKLKQDLMSSIQANMKELSGSE